MTVEQMGYFLKLAEELNYTAVANSFFITQPTLSRQIANLERELRVILFIREHNGVKLTPEGQVFYQRLKPIFLNLMKLVQDTQDLAIHKEELVIGMQEEQLMSNALNLAISKIRHEYPELKINIYRDEFENLTKGLEEGKYDLVNSMYFPNVRLSVPMDFIRLEQESMYMAISKRLAPDLPERLTLSELEGYLQQYPLLLPQMLGEYNTEDAGAEFVRNVGVSVANTKVIQSKSASMIPLQVITDQGVSICNLSNLYSVDPDVRIAEIPDGKPYEKGVFYRKQMDNPYLQTMIQLLKKEVEKMQ